MITHTEDEQAPPWEQAVALYASHFGDDGEARLIADIKAHCRTGYIHIDPEHVLIGYRVDNAWHIHLAVGIGPLNYFLTHMPYYLPYIGWTRRGRTRWYHTEQIISALTRKEQHGRKA